MITERYKQISIWALITYWAIPPWRLDIFESGKNERRA